MLEVASVPKLIYKGVLSFSTSECSYVKYAMILSNEHSNILLEKTLCLADIYEDRLYLFLVSVREKTSIQLMLLGQWVSVIHFGIPLPVLKYLHYSDRYPILKPPRDLPADIPPVAHDAPG